MAANTVLSSCADEWKRRAGAVIVACLVREKGFIGSFYAMDVGKGGWLSSCRCMEYAR